MYIYTCVISVLLRSNFATHKQREKTSYCSCDVGCRRLPKNETPYRLSLLRK